ncbi:MAG: AMP-binding protein, partial [Candidatus Bathyarchaeia archaeon]
CGVPAMYAGLLKHPALRKHKLDTIRRCISGAAPLSASIVSQFSEVTGGRLVEGYGLSEASPVTHCNRLDDMKKVKPGSIGIPFMDTQARIVNLDDPSKQLAAGEVGELAVKGPQAMLGYWNRPEETAAVLRKGWLLTGDIARMDEDGYFWIVDRKKDMINVGGFKVWPSEVEETLQLHPAVEEAAAISTPHPDRGEVVKAYVVPKTESRGKVTGEELIDFCKQKLAPHKVPRVIEFRDSLPKTMIGKILRRDLKPPT